MTEEQQKKYKRIAKWGVIIIYLLLLAPTYAQSVRNEGFSGRTSLLILAIMVLPFILYALIYIIRIVAKKRIEIDLASDHDRDSSPFSGIAVKHILIGIGIIVIMLFVVLIPAPWNIFILLGGTYAVFASFRYIS